MVPEPHAQPRRSAAFFDVDRTLLRGSSLLHVAGPMRRAGFLRTRAMLHAFVVQARFSAFGFDEVQIRDAVHGAGTLVAGIESHRLMLFAQRFIPTHVLPRVYAEARERIDWHHRRGDLVFLVSSSPREFIDVLGACLGADGVAATEAELVDGRYTGRILRLCHGAGKAESVRDLARAHGVDLATSYAYGDSLASDLQMLAAVGHPVCVNADRGLALHAQAAGWPQERFTRAGASTGVRRLHRAAGGVAHRSAPVLRSAGGHVRNTARSLREL